MDKETYEKLLNSHNKIYRHIHKQKIEELYDDILVIDKLIESQKLLEK